MRRAVATSPMSSVPRAAQTVRGRANPDERTLATGDNPDSGTEVTSPEDALIIGCVDRGLDVLGRSAKAATYYFIESKGGPRRADIPVDPDGLTNSLRKLFGIGARELLRAILLELRAAAREEGGEIRRVRDFIDAIERGVKTVERGIE